MKVLVIIGFVILLHAQLNPEVNAGKRRGKTKGEVSSSRKYATTESETESETGSGTDSSTDSDRDSRKSSKRDSKTGAQKISKKYVKDSDSSDPESQTDSSADSEADRRKGSKRGFIKKGAQKISKKYVKDSDSSDPESQTDSSADSEADRRKGSKRGFKKGAQKISKKRPYNSDSSDASTSSSASSSSSSSEESLESEEIRKKNHVLLKQEFIEELPVIWAHLLQLTRIPKDYYPYIAESFYRYSAAFPGSNRLTTHMKNILFLMKVWDFLKTARKDTNILHPIYRIVKQFPHLSDDFHKAKLLTMHGRLPTTHTLHIENLLPTDAHGVATTITQLPKNILEEIKTFVEDMIAHMKGSNLVKQHFIHASAMIRIFEKYKRSKQIETKPSILKEIQKETQVIMTNFRNEALAIENLMHLIATRAFAVDVTKPGLKGIEPDEADDKRNKAAVAIENLSRKDAKKIRDFINQLLPRMPPGNVFTYHFGNTLFILKFMEHLSGVRKEMKNISKQQLQHENELVLDNLANEKRAFEASVNGMLKAKSKNKKD